jgi:hypothetical protein
MCKEESKIDNYRGWSLADAICIVNIYSLAFCDFTFPDQLIELFGGSEKIIAEFMFVIVLDF